jgi:hypothetical protein
LVLVWTSRVCGWLVRLDSCESRDDMDICFFLGLHSPGAIRFNSTSPLLKFEFEFTRRETELPGQNKRSCLKLGRGSRGWQLSPPCRQQALCGPLSWQLTDPDWAWIALPANTKPAPLDRDLRRQRTRALLEVVSVSDDKTSVESSRHLNGPSDYLGRAAATSTRDYGRRDGAAWAANHGQRAAASTCSTGPRPGHEPGPASL